MKKITEWCPHCEMPVKIKPIKFIFQICPNCKEPIKACCLCDNDNVDCSKCKG